MTPLDLTLTISEKLPTFPGSPKPQFIPWNKIKRDGYNLELLFLSSHTGTHIDAPFHFIDKGKKIHDISVNRLVGRATLIKKRKKPNQSITRSDIINFEKKTRQNSKKCYCDFLYRLEQKSRKEILF